MDFITLVKYRELVYELQVALAVIRDIANGSAPAENRIKGIQYILSTSQEHIAKSIE